MKVEVKKSASKSLARIAAKQRQVIEKILLDIQDNIHTSEIPNDGKLRGYSDRYKIRSGNYRIIYKVEEENHITITAIAHRKDIYNKLFGLTLSL